MQKDQDSNYSGPDNEKMFIPSTTFRALHGDKYIDNMIFQANVAGDTKQMIDRIRAGLAKRLRFDPTDKEALSCWNTTEQFAFFESEAKRLLQAGLPLPGYEMILKAGHTFNLLDARGAISVTERAAYIGRIRTLSRLVALAYVESRKALGFPMLPAERRAAA